MTLIEKLAPYLPYKLKLWDFEKSKTKMMHCTQVNLPVVEPERYKPILRPLSDLDRVNFTHQVIGSNTLHYCAVLDDFETGDIDCTTLSYSHLQILIQNHYDVFGMIEDGLAIDINTL